MELRNLLGYGLVIFGTVMLILSPYGFDGTQPKTRTPSELPWSITIFIRKFLSYLGKVCAFYLARTDRGHYRLSLGSRSELARCPSGSLDDPSVAWALLVPYQLRVLKCLLLYMHSSVV